MHVALALLFFSFFGADKRIELSRIPDRVDDVSHGQASGVFVVHEGCGFRKK